MRSGCDVGGRAEGGAHDRAKGDEPDERMLRQQTQRDNDGILERLQVILVQAGVDDVEEDGRDLHRPRERVLDCGVFRQQLGREVVARDVLVVRRERVALEAEWADPELAAHVDLAVRV